MKQMQDEMWLSAELERERNGTEYPKVIPMFPGIARYVYSKEEEMEADKADTFAVMLFVGTLLGGLALFVGMILWRAL